MSYDFRVTVKDGKRAVLYEEVATRLSVAVSRALDKHEKAHKRERHARLLVEVQKVGVHKRKPCTHSCTSRSESLAASGLGGVRDTGVDCGKPCSYLENHQSLHRCAEHAR